MELNNLWNEFVHHAEKKIEYKTYKVFWKASKNNSKCRPCFYLSLMGVPRSEKTKNKIGMANSLSLIGNIPKNKGIAASLEQRKALSNAHTGMKYSEETKRKHRINRLKRLSELGIGTAIDKGSIEWFEKYNKETNSNFVPKRFWELGYDADGYDEIKHEWIEFDPPHHYYVDGNLKEKDIIRQKNIITHFEVLGNPLNKFVRVKYSKSGNVLDISEVYKGGQ